MSSIDFTLYTENGTSVSILSVLNFTVKRQTRLLWSLLFIHLSGEEPKKRKSKWDVSAGPVLPVKTATPPTKGGVMGPSVISTSDVMSAAKKPKILSWQWTVLKDFELFKQTALYAIRIDEHKW